MSDQSSEDKADGLDFGRANLQAAIDNDIHEQLEGYLYRIAGMVVANFARSDNATDSNVDLQHDLWLHLSQKIVGRYRQKKGSLSVDAYTYLFTAGISFLKDHFKKVRRQAALMREYQCDPEAAKERRKVNLPKIDAVADVCKIIKRAIIQAAEQMGTGEIMPDGFDFLMGGVTWLQELHIQIKGEYVPIATGHWVWKPKTRYWVE